MIDAIVGILLSPNQTDSEASKSGYTIFIDLPSTRSSFFNPNPQHVDAIDISQKRVEKIDKFRHIITMKSVIDWYCLVRIRLILFNIV